MLNEEQLFFSLRNLQYDYADCKGNHGPVLSQFTKILNRYQKNYYNWEPIGEDALNVPTPKYSLGSELKLIAIITAVFVLSAFILQNNFLSAVVYIVAGAFFAVRRDNIGWAILIIASTLSFMIVGKLFMENPSVISIIIFSVALVLYSVSALTNYFSAGVENKTYKSMLTEKANNVEKIEKDLVRDRKIMLEMLPSLVSEFKSVQKAVIEKSGCYIDNDLISLCSELPILYWWQILPWDLKKCEDSYLEKTNNSIVWETRWVNRTKGKEFPDAGKEYSPLMEYKDSSEEYKREYDNIKSEFFGNDSAGVFDFISRGTTVSMDEEYFQYEVYKHSSIERAIEKSLWIGIGHEIDDLYNSGQITKAQYDALIAEYFVSTMKFSEEINAKVEETGVKYRPVRKGTNLWVGQMLLADDDKGDGLVVVDYRCQIPHIFKNIDALHDVKITRVSGDPVKRNPMVMAKFHKVCDLCR